VNIPETADLIELLAAANVLNRLDPKTPEVWAAALGDLEYRDCMQAAAVLIRTAQWVKIADVRDAVHDIRAERIRNANVVYDGQPEETGTQSAANIRALVDAAGDGRFADRTIGEALITNPPALRGRALLALESGVGREVPSPRAGVVNVLAVACPHCGAPARKTCRTRGKSMPDAHPARLEDARRIAAGQTPADRSAEERERERRLEASRAALAALPPGTVIEPDDGWTPGGSKRRPKRKRRTA
jgi:hypothetical protein